MPLSTIIFFVVTATIMVGGLVYSRVSKAKAKAAFQAAVKANPGAYYVSQGGTLPDPVVVDTPIDTTAQ